MTELSFEEYAEPACLLCGDEPYRIPTARIIEKLDELLGRNDYAAAERHLNYWLEDAVAGEDLRGQLTLREEQMGLFRKLGREAEAVAAAEEALRLLSRLGLEGSLTAATVQLNAATVFGAFGRLERAEALFLQAKDGYEKLLSPDDPRLAGLCNNMALTLTALGRFNEAKSLYHRALAIMSGAPDGQGEQAITLLNLANLVEAESGLEAGDREICRLLEKAEDLLAEAPDSSRNAFVFEKCAPTFSYYGWFATGEGLAGRAAEIYEKERKHEGS